MSLKYQNFLNIVEINYQINTISQNYNDTGTFYKPKVELPVFTGLL